MTPVRYTWNFSVLHDRFQVRLQEFRWALYIVLNTWDTFAVPDTFHNRNYYVRVAIECCTIYAENIWNSNTFETHTSTGIIIKRFFRTRDPQRDDTLQIVHYMDSLRQQKIAWDWDYNIYIIRLTYRRYIYVSFRWEWNDFHFVNSPELLVTNLVLYKKEKSTQQKATATTTKNPEIMLQYSWMNIISEKCFIYVTRK